MLTAMAGVSCLIWIYLVTARGMFWRCGSRLVGTPKRASPPKDGRPWPAVVALVPARNEADVVATAIRSLLTQDYPGRLEVVLIDDHSSDGTAETAAAAAAAAGAAARLHPVAARPLPPGWSGKVWALAEGLAAAERDGLDAPYLWLSDADIAYAPDCLLRLMTKAEASRLDLVSLMVGLSCRSGWERLLIPPFIYFFQKLYPFAWANDPRRRTAAAAGGCMLVRRDALARAGGFAFIGSALIDDCSLARRIKALSGEGRVGGGGIWIGLTTQARSLRSYRGLGDIWRMVARTAYTQLGYAPLALAGTIIGMIVTYILPPALTLTYPLHGDGGAAFLSGMAWLLMTVSILPTLTLYGVPRLYALALPVAAALYSGMTLDSAMRHWRGRGGSWKGRVHAPAGGLERQPPVL